jgi:hypothetical protein
MRDEKRGFTGNVDDGEIILVFRDMYRCKIWIGEGTYGDGGKDITMANWATDLEFTVNGKSCKPPYCTVSMSGGSYAYEQRVQIDTKELLGNGCRRGDVEVGIKVNPAPPTSHMCKIMDGFCRPSGEYFSYNDIICNKTAGRDVSLKAGSECGVVPRYTNKSKISTFIAYAVSF